jgi:hypothetical protein
MLQVNKRQSNKKTKIVIKLNHSKPNHHHKYFDQFTIADIYTFLQIKLTTKNCLNEKIKFWGVIEKTNLKQIRGLTEKNIKLLRV